MGLKVLVVDDYEDGRVLTGMLLESAGYSVSSASDGEAAVKVAEAERPALVLMDMYLPRMDGIEASRRIKANPHLRNVPIVAYTARVMPVREPNLFAAVCVKPCAPDILLATVRRLLGDAAAALPGL